VRACRLCCQLRSICRYSAHRYSRAMRRVLMILPMVAVLAGGGIGLRAVLQDRQHERQLALARDTARQRLWEEAEDRLSECANVLTGAMGQSDAGKNIRRGDTRLYKLVSSYQESWSTEVPGLSEIEPSRDPTAKFVTGRRAPSSEPKKFEIVLSPMGRIWTDPWGMTINENGKPPPSAEKCNQASRAYVLAYNRTVLRFVGNGR
jgi:hypothetical protein